MPQPIQVFTYLIPARYFITALKAIYLKGVGLEVIYIEILFLTGFAVLVLALASAKLKKRLD
jgi:ABC-2 type transport system permease protein